MILATNNSHRFQSTPSVGRATQTFGVSLPTSEISIHALRGEGDNKNYNRNYCSDISIHALRGEGDQFFQAARFSC